MNSTARPASTNADVRYTSEKKPRPSTKRVGLTSLTSAMSRGRISMDTAGGLPIVVGAITPQRIGHQLTTIMACAGVVGRCAGTGAAILYRDAQKVALRCTSRSDYYL